MHVFLICFSVLMCSAFTVQYLDFSLFLFLHIRKSRLLCLSVPAILLHADLHFVLDSVNKSFKKNKNKNAGPLFSVR